MAMSKTALGAALLAAAQTQPDGDPAAKWNKVAAEIIDEIKKATVTVPAAGLVSAAPGSPVGGSATGTIT